MESSYPDPAGRWLLGVASPVAAAGGGAFTLSSLHHTTHTLPHYPPRSTPPPHPCAAHSPLARGIIKKRAHLRNKFNAQISEWRRAFGVRPDGDVRGIRDQVLSEGPQAGGNFTWRACPALP